MADNDAFDENRERQQAEFEFIQAAYLPEEAWVIVEEDSCGGDDKGDRKGLAPIKRICRRLELPLGSVTDDPSSAYIPLELVLTLPPSYPTDERAILGVDASLSHTRGAPAKISASHRKCAIDALPHLLQSCRTIALESAGSESVFLVLSNAETWIEEEWPNHCLQFDGEELSSTKQPTISEGANNQIIKPIVLGRKLIYSHHIIAKSKRKAIGDLAKDYNLGGYFKIGWPGIIVVEGREEDCQSFYDQIRTMRWQYLVIRGEEREEISPGDETTDLDGLRRFPIAMKELGEDKMSHLSELCREAGLEDLFLTSMKIYRQESDEGGESTQKFEASQMREDLRHGILVLVDHMNDPKGYTKWLHKACKSAGCSCLVLHCFPNDDIVEGRSRSQGHPQSTMKSRARPIIVVGLIGDDESSLKQVLKRWRTSRVDVDSKGNPCLERMMDVLVEGALESQVDDDKHILMEPPNGDGRVTRTQLESTLKSIGGSIDPWPGGLAQMYPYAEDILSEILKGVVEDPADSCSSQVISASDCCGFFVQESTTSSKNDVAALLFPGVDQLKQIEDIEAMVGDKRALILFNKQFQLPVDFGFFNSGRSEKAIFDRYSQGFAFQEFACRGEDLKLTFEYPNWQSCVICEEDDGNKEIDVLPPQTDRPQYEDLEKKINEVLPEPLWMRKIGEVETKGFKFQRGQGDQ